VNSKKRPAAFDYVVDEVCQHCTFNRHCFYPFRIKVLREKVLTEDVLGRQPLKGKLLKGIYSRNGRGTRGRPKG
jgi:hypothetical protein